MTTMKGHVEEITCILQQVCLFHHMKHICILLFAWFVFLDSYKKNMWIAVNVQCLAKAGVPTQTAPNSDQHTAKPHLDTFRIVSHVCCHL